MQYKFLTFEDRRKIETLYNSGTRVAEIAQAIGHCENTIYKDLRKGLTDKSGRVGRRIYSAQQAEESAKEGLKKRGNRAEARNKGERNQSSGA
jgi:IS30 family transposase